MLTTRTQISYTNGKVNMYLGVDVRVADNVLIITDMNGTEKVTTIVPLDKIDSVQAYGKNDKKVEDN